MTAGERTPGAGPWPLPAEVAAARERLDLHDLGQRDYAAAMTLVAVLGHLVRAVPATAGEVAAALAGAVEALAEAHAACRHTGCSRCLYLTEAGAVAHAWAEPAAPDPHAEERAAWERQLAALRPPAEQQEEGRGGA